MRETSETNDRGNADEEWWEEAIVYQVYPRSFNDTDGDGIGDLPGVVDRIDYLDDLGVDVVWLNPVYESPNADNGYDISDYRTIMAEFGTMADWEAVLDGLHDREMRLVMDLAVNHTSDEHEWFRRSRDPDSAYHDWYHWVEGSSEKPPNDWESFFGGPAWSYDDEVGKWYLHLFDEKQPDLNWRSPDVREAVCDVVEWWLEKGVDGFRLDVINLVSKPDGYPDGERGDVVVRGADRFVNGPRLGEYLGELFEVIGRYDAMTVGEMVDIDIEQAVEFVGPDGTGMSMAFSFDHMRLDHGPAGRWDSREWTLEEFREVIGEWQTGLHGRGWNSVFLGNHDQPRAVSRFGDDEAYREESAKLLATLLFTLEGTPYVFQGDEIGMTNYPWESLDEIRDVDTLRNVEVAREAGRLEDGEVMELVRQRSRDNARTPMQWDDTEHAGFTSGDPWLPVNPNYGEVNVAAARADPDSVWHYYRDLIELRDEHDVLIYGEYADLDVEHGRMWVYERTLDDERAVVVLGFASEPVRFDPGSVGLRSDATYRIGNYLPPDDPATLRPHEARVYVG
jgi:glycosidase